MELKQLNLSNVDLQQIVADHFAHCKEKLGPTIWRAIGAKLEPFSSCPDGFLAEHYAMKIAIEAANGQSEELSFFVKCSPVDNPALALYLEEIKSFHKETHVLNDIVRTIQRYCSWRTFAPTVHLAKGFNLLVMNNLKSDGFAVIKCESGLLNGAFLRQALESLACLHAGSIVLEEKNGKPLPQLFPEVLDENAWVTTPTSTRVQDVANVILLYTKLVIMSDKWSVSQKDLILAQLPQLFKTIYRYTKPSDQFRNCLNHGDLWCNNMMFNCDSQGNPIGCILVDYQMSRYVPPAYDVNLLLYLTASRQLRTEQRQTLLMHYYECFFTTMQQNQLATDNILPHKAFLESCEHYRLAGLIHSTMISAEVTLPSAFLEEVFNRSELTAGFMPEPKVWVCVKAFQSDPIYRMHLLELMDELFSYILNPVLHSAIQKLVN